MALIAGCFALLAVGPWLTAPAHAQSEASSVSGEASPDTDVEASAPSAAQPGQNDRTTGPRERVEADVSTRNVAVETDFSGVQIVLFGAIKHSRAMTANDGYYDVAIVIEGPREDIMVRQKSRVAGIWVNTESRPFKAVPSYYGILSTRPVQDIARASIREWLGVGFDHTKMLPAGKFEANELTTYRNAVVRLKQSEGLYIEQSDAVEFIGTSLFRAEMELPANVSVGRFNVRVLLFHNGEFLDRYQTEVSLEREGFERAVYRFAFDYPFWYGVVAVLVAVLAGLGATQLFRRD